MERPIRDESNTLLELEASEAPGRLQADLSVLQILLHARTKACRHLATSDLAWSRKNLRKPICHPPGRLEVIGWRSRYVPYFTPKTRTVHGRVDAISGLDDWFESGSPCMVIHGIAGIGKSTLVANWLGNHMHEAPHLSVC